MRSPSGLDEACCCADLRAGRDAGVAAPIGMPGLEPAAPPLRIASPLHLGHEPPPLRVSCRRSLGRWPLQRCSSIIPGPFLRNGNEHDKGDDHEKRDEHKKDEQRDEDDVGENEDDVGAKREGQATRPRQRSGTADVNDGREADNGDGGKKRRWSKGTRTVTGMAVQCPAWVPSRDPTWNLGNRRARLLTIHQWRPDCPREDKRHMPWAPVAWAMAYAHRDMCRKLCRREANGTPFRGDPLKHV